jgi:hypothetical protein
MILSTVVNIVLCAAIIFLGGLVYRKNKTTAALFIAIAFALFGVSYLLAPGNVALSMRVIAYAAMMLALYKIS